jgi:hypothetical protein
MTAAVVPQPWREPVQGDLQEVNGLSPPDALAWYTVHGYAARPASPNAKMLTLPRGYHYDDLAVLGEQELASAYHSWRQKPGQRVALILGRASGLVAIDVDDLGQWEKFRAEHGDKIPRTAVQATGRNGGGFHLLYWRGDLGPDLLNTGRWPDLPGIELKSKGIIIAAPSLYDATGVCYQWQQGPGRPALISQALAAGFAEGKRQQDAVVRELVQLVEAGDRPRMLASNAADFADTLCTLLGVGQFTGVHQRDDRLVTVPRVGERGYVPAPGSDEDPRKNSPAQIRVLDQHLLQGFVASRAWTYKLVPDGKDTVKKVHTLPPLAACSAAIHADPARWERVPVLTGVIHTPLLRPDGSLLAEPGYDEATGLLYLPPPGQDPVAVPERPSRQDAEAAASRVWTLFRDFGWLSKGDYLNYLAAVLVPPLRLLLPPPWPLWVVNAHDRGSGKTLLTEVPRILHGGVLYAAPGDDSEETRKMIGTILASTTGSVVELDNAEKVFRSRHFAALFTDPSGTWHDRKLGTNTSPGLPNDRVWMLNGNNVQLGGDLPRRALWATIDPGVPEPWLRTEFAIPDLAGYVRDNRQVILADLLVLGRHWVAEGRQAGSAARGDSFAPFAAGMSGLQESCGLAGHGEFWSAATNKAADGADDEDWAGFLAAVYAQWGSGRWTARDLIKKAGETVTTALPGDLADRLNRGDDVANPLGRWLANHQGRWTSGRHAVRQVGGGTGGHPKLWAVEHRQAV